MTYIITDWMNNVCFDSDKHDFQDEDIAYEFLEKHVIEQLKEDDLEPYEEWGDMTQDFQDYLGEYFVQEYNENTDRLFWIGNRYVLKSNYYEVRA